MRNQPQPAPGIALAGAGTTQVDYGCQILFLPERGLGDPRPCQRPRDALVEICGGELDRVRGDDARIQTVEPAGAHVMPRSVYDDDVIVDAIASRFFERSVGDLVHADGAGRRPIDV